METPDFYGAREIFKNGWHILKGSSYHSSVWTINGKCPSFVAMTRTPLITPCSMSRNAFRYEMTRRRRSGNDNFSIMVTIHCDDFFHQTHLEFYFSHFFE